MENGKENRNFIKQIRLLGFWGRFNIVWNLHEDVNILSGKNGSGKSTLLELCHWVTTQDRKTSIKERLGQFDEIQIVSTEGEFNYYDKSKSDKTAALLSGAGWGYLPSVDLISTFDNVLLNSEAIQKLSDDNVKTDLDWQIYKLQKEYLDYQLKIGKQLNALYASENPDRSKAENLQKPQRDFIKMLNNLFAETDKKVDESANEISFLLDGTQEITPYQLSSGEKQMLIILLTVLIQNQQPTVLFMDEPEISLHIDWQKKLLTYMRTLNPNVQIIVATHSPALIMDGWMDKVFNLEDLIVRETSNA